MKNLKEMREKHATLLAEARSIIEKPGLLSDEDSTKVDKIYEDADNLAKNIEREKVQAEREQRLQASLGERAEKNGKGDDEQNDHEKRYGEAFWQYARHGVESLNPEQRSLIQANYIAPGEQRAQSISGGSPVGIYGGYLVPEDFSNQLEESMLAYGGMLEAADVFETATGASLPWPTTNDTANKGAILGENQPITEQDITFSQVTFTHYTYTSKLMRLSWALMQDSAFNLPSHLAGVAGERLGRILNEHFTTGTGSSQPSGVITGAGLGLTTGLQSAFTYDELVNFQHSLDPAYRTPDAIWMFNDGTLKALRKLKDSSNRPLFWNDTGNLASGVSPLLLGHRYVINQDVASLGAAAKFALFGQFKKYKIRRIKGYTLVRLNERYAEMLQTGFFVYARFDGRLLDAGTDPIKYLANKSASP
jgi:HK97 family phage major capsid protein